MAFIYLCLIPPYDCTKCPSVHELMEPLVTLEELFYLHLKTSRTCLRNNADVKIINDKDILE